MNRKKTLPDDVKRLCVEFIRSYEVRKKRYPESLLYFDRRAMNAVKKAFDELGSDIADPKIQKEIQKKVYESVAKRTPYRYLGETYCGESKFYKYRKEVFISIAENMGMI